MEALRRADRRKDEFLAMLAHELRNPLAALSGAVQAMEQKSLTHRPLDELQKIGKRQIRHLTRLVDDLLDVSRITSNKITLRVERLDLGRVLESVLDTTRPLATARGQTVTYEASRRPLLVEGDPLRLEQIFANLVHNAIKYTGDGGQVRVAIESVPGGSAPAAVRVVVRDNGRGIAPALLPNIFEIFVQGDITIDRSEGGLGLGLTLVRRLVEMHGGRVSAESAGPGCGSTFTVELPAVELPDAVAEAVAGGDGAEAVRGEEADKMMDKTTDKTMDKRTDKTAERATDQAAGAMVSPSTGRHIVLVDDNQDAAVLLKDFLEMCGHVVEVAYDGERGRDLILHAKPHVAFVDLGLPKLDGFEVARQVRRSDATRGIRLIALTGYGDSETRVRATAAGFDEHVVKPLEVNDLERLLA
jgi:two-component system, sensor histidine kinase